MHEYKKNTTDPSGETSRQIRHRICIIVLSVIFQFNRDLSRYELDKIIETSQIAVEEECYMFGKPWKWQRINTIY